MLIMSVRGLALLLIGLWGILTAKAHCEDDHRLLDHGYRRTLFIIVSLGYLPGRTAPIFSIHFRKPRRPRGPEMVDPVPQALVLTAIVIGLAVTALMLSFAIRMHAAKKSASIDDFEEMKW